jgi:hypothetical protein
MRHAALLTLEVSHLVHRAHGFAVETEAHTTGTLKPLLIFAVEQWFVE